MNKQIVTKKISDIYDFEGKKEKLLLFRIYRSTEYLNHFIIRLGTEGNSRVNVQDTYIKFNVENVDITESYRNMKYQYLNSDFNDRNRSQAISLVNRFDGELLSGKFYEIASIEDYNLFIDKFSKIMATAKQKEKENKKKELSTLKTIGNENQKIIYIYKNLRRSGYIKKNNVLLGEKISNLKKDLNYSKEIDIIEVSYAEYSLKIVNFEDTEYMICVYMDNKSKSKTETILIALKDKLSLFNVILKLNLIKISTKEDSTNSHYIELYKEYIDGNFEESTLSDYFNVSRKIISSSQDKRTFLEIEYKFKQSDLSYTNTFEVIPTKDQIILLSNSENHKNILTVTNKLIKRANYEFNTQLAIIEEIENSVSMVENFELIEENISLPNFKSIKQMLTWLKLKKINIL